MSEFGLNFLPAEGAPDQASSTALTPAQSAIKILSLRLPQILGMSSPVDRSLLTANPGQAPSLVGNPVSAAGVNVENDFVKPTTPVDANAMVMESLRRAYAGGGTDVNGLMRSLGFPTPDSGPRAMPTSTREGYTVRTSFGDVNPNGPQAPNPYQSPAPAPQPTPTPNPTPTYRPNMSGLMGGRQG